ncbi:MAG TPA: DUF429 domain-containing protein [Jatrophihabitans sp.]|nr:DUF429 domain-containing protein [Jatrophihabitans sp.]
MDSTVGIDLAGSAKRTAVCTVTWSADGPRVAFEEQRGDDALRELIVRCAAAGAQVGIDCPLGWPELFVATVSAYSARSPLPVHPVLELQPEPAGRDRPVELNPLLYRLTDDVVWQQTKSRPPLSVAADLLGVVALRCARILNAAEWAGVTVDRSGCSGVLAEVYPAATLRTWQLSGRTSYKRPTARPARQAIVELLECKLELELAPDVREQCVASHDHLDALIAAFAARAVALGRSTRPTPGIEAERAATEGWIHLPTCGPRDLLP